MSDLGFSRRNAEGERPPDQTGRRLPESLSRPSAFQPDARFAGDMTPAPAADPAPPPPNDQPDSTDPVAEAFNHGFAMGHEQASREAQIRADAEAAARTGLSLAFERLDAALEEELRLRLRDTVSALCESAIAPLAIEPDALLRRISVAVAMLKRAEDERLVRLHPDDLRLVSPRLSAEWQVQPDATLERGTVRIETATGGVEDGPANWRRAIAEALQRC
ncbi:FliH/SctL family protein [Novosphingobium sp. TCA1]|uniref:Flagellar assembly protein FliH n=1 Tax=Novosphingobium pentaromativorans TaxID=205844 RepID=A0A2W5NMG3_9SPHN|nr:FliH/SctL family protein [Novosphingobium sp. TCA1]PZQ54672.1 MAG: flagellar biosynthesis protein [Novosphingobium pentaromativorans]GFE75127.1 hypothetical protein NTCA1_27760 [Novosphingobium sp. TCA1]